MYSDKPKVSPEPLRDVELQPSLQQVSKNGLQLHQHLPMSVFAVRIRGGGGRVIIGFLGSRKKIGTTTERVSNRCLIAKK